ncbi:hypothetical protein IFM47457_08586 [Aspergillus lentulus]|nr:hypothetical protein IFM47457_08586 [Aspergillus lentulus]
MLVQIRDPCQPDVRSIRSRISVQDLLPLSLDVNRRLNKVTLARSKFVPLSPYPPPTGYNPPLYPARPASPPIGNVMK